MITPARREALLGTASVAADLAAAGLAGCIDAGNNAAEPPSETQRNASDKAEVSTSPSSDMPFSLEGVPCEGDVVQTQRAEAEARLSGEWTFGGDYAQT